MQEVTETSTRVEDFEGLKEHVKELKNKYVKKKTAVWYCNNSA
jgi:hypothetical protein